MRPFPRVSATSPIRPNAGLGNITLVESATNSNYNALWITATKRLSHGFQFNAAYTFSHSIDYNSLSSQGAVVQDSNNLRGDRASSDFDARHRFVISALYELPFKGNRWVEGWEIGSIVTYQSAFRFTVLAGSPPACPPPPATPTPGCGAANNAFTGLATLRPDLTATIQYFKDPSLWFSNATCNPIVTMGGPGICPSSSVFTLPVSSSGVYHFGNLGRNTLIGPRFSNTDFSIIKRTRITELVRVEFRADMFDVFNHPNFGLPNRVAVGGSTTFGTITNTRSPTGDAGSSRQIQFALKFIF